MITRVSAHNADEMLDSGSKSQVIDVREPSGFNSERIADEQLVPRLKLEKRLASEAGVDRGRQ